MRFAVRKLLAMRR